MGAAGWPENGVDSEPNRRIQDVQTPTQPLIAAMRAMRKDPTDARCEGAGGRRASSTR
jgi:hypothetical protein